MYALTLGKRKIKLTFHCIACCYLLLFSCDGFVFHLLPQTDKKHHISGMREEINERHGEKLGIIIGNV